MRRGYDELLKENNAFRAALRNISDPIGYLSAEAKRAGGQLDGDVAVQLSNDANWLKDMARSALCERT